VRDLGREGGAMEQSRKEDSCGHEPAVQNSILHIPSILYLLAGIIAGAICSGPWVGDLMVLIRGYRWDYTERCILVDPDTDGFGTDFCRLPVDCSVCSGVKQIDEIHINNLTVEMFYDKYASKNRPLVVREAAASWKALQVLDYYWLKEMYLRNPDDMDQEGKDCWFNLYKTRNFRNLRSVFRLSEERVNSDTSKPWYVGWGVCHKRVAQEIYKLYQRPTFLHPDSTPPKQPWLFLGKPGPGAHLHIDNVNLPSWQAQVKGVKTWYLQSPPECWTYCNGIMETTIYPGDIITVNTNLWFHGTKIHSPELSVSLVGEFD